MTTNEITGSASITLGAVTAGPPTNADAFLGIAQQFMNGARVLAADPNCSIPFALLCGHVSECLFKSFLSWKGTKFGFTHNLSKLRSEAVENGLAIDPTEPSWLTILNRTYHASTDGNNKHLLRYPMGTNGLGTPATQPMLSDLEALLKLVQARQ